MGVETLEFEVQFVTLQAANIAAAGLVLMNQGFVLAQFREFIDNCPENISFMTVQTNII